MAIYSASFIGRQLGAIGIFYPIRFELEAPDLEAAKLKLYETHEHLSDLRIVPAHRWQIVDTWNGGEGGRKVVFTSAQTGNEGHNECFAWVHRNRSQSFDWETRHGGLKVEPAEA